MFQGFKLYFLISPKYQRKRMNRLLAVYHNQSAIFILYWIFQLILEMFPISFFWVLRWQAPNYRSRVFPFFADTTGVTENIITLSCIKFRQSTNENYFCKALYTNLYINGLYINWYLNLHIWYINTSVYILIYIFRSIIFYIAQWWFILHLYFSIQIEFDFFWNFFCFLVY